MIQRLRRFAVSRTAVATLAGGMVLGGAAMKFHGGNPEPVYVFAQSDAGLPPGGFTQVVRRAAPAVVNVSTTTMRRTRASARRNTPVLPPGFEDFFGGGLPEQPRERRGESRGSGVIVSPQGYVLTNAHVVEDATEVRVALNDRREFTAKIIGSDRQTDVAVLKLEEPNLPVLPISDSSKVQVGDLALAIGNPFGIGQTVTMGIIGATGRRGLGIEAYEDFIQTDAAINPGNSGGALVNTRGELVGINTAILSGGGGNQGIGFAIPINMVREVMDQLVKSGKVTRGYMGAGLADVNAGLSKALKVAPNSGVAITRVEPGLPAEKAGLRSYDVITAVNGQKVTDLAQLRLLVARNAPGTTVRLNVTRDGKSIEVPVTLAEFPADAAGEDNDNDERQPTARPTSMDGVEIQALNPRLARQLGVPPGTSGVVVAEIDPNSAAAAAGLRPRDVIVEVNRKPVTSEAEFDSALRGAGSGPTLLLVRREGGNVFVTVEPRR